MRIKTTIIFTVEELIEKDLLQLALKIKEMEFYPLDNLEEIEFSIPEAHQLGFTARQLGLA